MSAPGSAPQAAAHLPDMTRIIADPQPATPTPQPLLTANDRCDRCGAQAYAKSVHGEVELLWCAHHLRQHRDRLGDALVLDETHRLEPGNRQQGADHA